MACTIDYNKNGNIIKVNTPRGEESKLFNQIAKLPHVDNLEEALEIYKNTYTEEFKTNRVFYSIIGEKGANNVEEYKRTLDEAKEMFSNGESLDAISAKTGWYKQGENWKKLSIEAIEQLGIKKYETNKIYRLNEILENNILFRLYPEINEYSVVFYNNTMENQPQETLPWGNSYGALKEEKKLIGINLLERGDERDDQAIRRTLAHELTHVLQTLEKFPVGGGYSSIILETNDILGISDETSFKQKLL